MKHFLIVMILCGMGWPQNGAYAPLGGIPQAGAAQQQLNIQQQQLNQNAQAQRIQAELVRQQTELLKQQTEALRQQNELAKQQLAAKTFSPPIRKPRIDDIDAVTGKPRFANYADYEDAKDEWLIDETLRRLEIMEAAKAKHP